MSIGLYELNVGIGIAAFAWIFWWMYALTSRSHARRAHERALAKTPRQPWTNDKAGGRGNR